MILREKLVYEIHSDVFYRDEILALASYTSDDTLSAVKSVLTFLLEGKFVCFD